MTSLNPFFSLSVRIIIIIYIFLELLVEIARFAGPRASLPSPAETLPMNASCGPRRREECSIIENAQIDVHDTGHRFHRAHPFSRRRGFFSD